MKRELFISLLLIPFALFAQTKIISTAPSARSIPFDSDWLFTRNNVSNAEQADFSDAKWRKLDLPHDWSIEDLPNQTPDSIIGPFNRKSSGGIFTGYTIGGTGGTAKSLLQEMRCKIKILPSILMAFT